MSTPLETMWPRRTGAADVAGREREWSELLGAWSQLEPGPRQCLAQLAVFESRFTAADALEVVDVPGMFVPDGLEALHAAALLRLEHGSLQLLEAVRRFVRTRLAPDHPAWERHARWATAGPVELEGLSGPERDALIARARTRIHDLHAVLRRQPHRAARAALWLCRSSAGSSAASAWRAVLDLGLAGPGEAGTEEARAQLWLLAHRGRLALCAAQPESGMCDLESARTAAAAAEEWSPWALATHELALVALHRGDIAEARDLLDETRTQVRDRGMVGSWARAELGLSLVAEQAGDLEAARRHVELALRLFQELEDVGNEALAEVHRGRLLGDEPALGRQAAPEGIVVRRDGQGAVTPDGTRVDLCRHPLLGRILVMLAQQRERAPGVPAPRAAVLEAGWPGERMLPAASRNRVYVSIARLRRAGLGPLLQTGDGGYLLDPGVGLVWR